MVGCISNPDIIEMVIYFIIGNPSAVDMFHKISNALEILTDKAARAAYDQVCVFHNTVKNTWTVDNFFFNNFKL